MCGIVGFVNCGDREQLYKAVEAIGHRGPDGSGVEWFPEVNSGLGHARLAIIDLSENGRQPMFDTISGNWLVFNGEVYNYQAIKQELQALGHTFKTGTDTEVILASFNQWGEACLGRFHGMFAFAIFNPGSGELFAARDRQGIKPFYYWHQSGALAFGSEIKSFFHLDSFKASPDWRAIQTQAHFQISPHTGFKDVLKLKAGHFMKFNREKGLEIKCYWKIHASEEDIPEEEALSHLDNLLSEVVTENLVADTPVGVMLSGGLDSSILAGMMQKRMDQSLNSFTIKFREKDLQRQGNVDDSHYAKKMADEFGFNHREIVIDPDVADLMPKMVYHLDEPIADPAAINTYLISQAAREHGIYVLLTGMGADEVFGGYRSYLACLKANSYQKIPEFFRNGLEWVVSKLPESNSRRNFKYIRWLKRFTEIGSLSHFDRQLLIKNSALNQKRFLQYFENALPFDEAYYYDLQKAEYERHPELSYLTNMCLLDSQFYMVDHNLTYADKSMMAAGVEGRPTLIDHRIVEFMFGLKPDFRIQGGVQKYLLKKLSEKYIPNEVTYRPKAPFSAPMRGWLKDELKEMVMDILSFESLKKRGVYNAQFVTQLLKENDRGIRDNSQLIWRLMVNEIWFRKFFD